MALAALAAVQAVTILAQHQKRAAQEIRLAFRRPKEITAVIVALEIQLAVVVVVEHLLSVEIPIQVTLEMAATARPLLFPAVP